ncbi:hypothetical protein SmJEL517_g02841 [Synchytrium microbalum]|uniref:Protein kinase domain-containing protein n=1 Tax=Synchytrium microbalum TaxID=1806994 RepID=A0A507C969_9FUNG|nr:uncharacterized protein SmJEL517_g02841 [Synchytrium microbalum]TPX34514.1 hypothetical protein SmJEL517_g02841 [Synchytrium microbalum]
MADDGALKRSRWALDGDDEDDTKESTVKKRSKKTKKQDKGKQHQELRQRVESPATPIIPIEHPINSRTNDTSTVQDETAQPTLQTEATSGEQDTVTDYDELQDFEPPLKWMRVHIDMGNDDADTSQQPQQGSDDAGEDASIMVVDTNNASKTGALADSPIYQPAPIPDEFPESPDSPLDDSEDVLPGAPDRTPPPTLLPHHHAPTTITKTPAGPLIAGCRSVDAYEKLNRIEEGAYGVVYRARDKVSGEIVALKKLKLDKEKMGFPVTSLREIHTLLLSKHVNIVDVKEIVVSNNLQNIFIVMEFVEHDLKALMESMREPFLQSEIKTLMQQILSAAACLHSNWIIHRDLKTSNLLMNNRGMIKVADFGLARRFGEPLGNMTQLVVTLWYRAPELLLGAKEYTTAIDMWSIGCIFGEIVNKEPLLPGRGDMDQLTKIFKLLGTPTEELWPGLKELPVTKTIVLPSYPYAQLRSRFPYLTENGLDLMSGLLVYDPSKRLTAEQALKHPFFSEHPPPKPTELFPTFPSKGLGEKKRRVASPSAPVAGHGLVEDADEAELKAQLGVSNTFKSTGFRLNFKK